MEFDADVDVEEMKKSDSKDKYLHSWCQRKTVYLTLEPEKTKSEDISSHNFSDDLFEHSYEDLSEDVPSNDLVSPTKNKIK